MTSGEIVNKSKAFAAELKAKLSDPTETVASKQVYFMDNHERIQKIMGALNQVVDNITAALGEGEIPDEEQNALEEAQAIVSEMKQTITEFQQTLVIDQNVTEEELATPSLTPEAVAEATKENKAVQQMMENVEAAKSMKNVPYNYALVCDGVINLLGANTKDELNKAINDIVDKGNYKSINLYQLQFTPMALKKKTILSV